MSEQKPIKPADLARHFGCSPAYISKLRLPVGDGGKAMPDFFTLEDADTWRSIHAPPKLRRRGSAEPPSPIGEKLTPPAENFVPIPGTTTSTPNPPPAPAGTKGKQVEGGGTVIDVRAFIQSGVDFDALMIANAETVPQVAYGLYLRACESGNPVAIASALANWNDAMKAAATARAAFITVQERTRALLPLDQVMDIVGTELQAVRSDLSKLGERFGAIANPKDPEVGRHAIDAAVDSVLAKFEVLTARTSRELAVSA